MTLRQRIGGFLLRSSVGDANNFLLNLINKTLTSSAQNVNDETALKVSAVYACVKVISEAIASLPLMLYKRKGDGKEVADGHYLYSILHDAPNEYQTSFEFRETLLANLLLQGNSYCQKVEDGTGKITQLISFNPKNMEVEQNGNGITYKYTYEDGHSDPFPASKMWHVRNLPLSTTDNGNMPQGLVGLSPITLARENVGIAMAADEYAGRYFSNNATIGLALQYPEAVKLSQDAKNYANEKLALYSEGKNKFKSIILDQGGSLNKIGMSNEDSQFLESRNFQVEDIARIFRVPPVLIGHPTNTMTYASAEQLFLSFATYTIRPWCVRLEQSMNRYLLNDRERGKYFFEFKMDGLLRGDLAGRYTAYATARQWGWMNVDEIRALENMNPIPDGTGQQFMQPMNMTKLGQEPQPTEPQTGQKSNIKRIRSADKVDWEKVYAEGGAHWTDDMQPSKFAQNFAEKLVEENKESILEIGCGNGRDSILFALAGIKVTAIDLVSEAVEMAKENAKNAKVEIDFKTGNAEKLKFDDDSFDSLFTLSVLHSTDMKKSIPEVYRVMKNKGMAFVYVYSNVEKIDGTKTDFISVDEYINLARDSGFKFDDIYTLPEEEYDEAGEKHLIIVSELRK